MENNTDMKQYLDPQFIYVAEISTNRHVRREYRKAFAVSKEALRNYAKWIDADRFKLSETFEISDGVLSKEALQLDDCESITKEKLREYIGKNCKFLPGEIAIAKDDNKYAITTNGWQGVVLAIIRRPDTNDPDLIVQDVEGSDIPYIVEQSAFRAPYDTAVPPNSMFAEFEKLSQARQEEILTTIGLQYWAKANELEFTYDDTKKCIALHYGDDDYMHSEYSDVYSEDGDMTFIMRYDYYHLDGTIDTNVTGFYHGRPDEQNDAIYRDTVVSVGKQDDVRYAAGEGTLAVTSEEE